MSSAYAVARSSRSHWRYGLILFAILLAASGTYWYWQYGPTAFDAAVWRGGENAQFDSNAPRLRMADGLLWFRTLRGQSRPALEELLGPATPTDKWRDWDLVYWLGAERGFIGIDSEWLAIRFNGNGVVSEAKIIRD